MPIQDQYFVPKLKGTVHTKMKVQSLSPHISGVAYIVAELSETAEVDGWLFKTIKKAQHNMAPYTSSSVIQVYRSPKIQNWFEMMIYSVNHHFKSILHQQFKGSVLLEALWSHSKKNYNCFLFKKLRQTLHQLEGESIMTEFYFGVNSSFNETAPGSFVNVENPLFDKSTHKLKPTQTPECRCMTSSYSALCVNLRCFTRSWCCLGASQSWLTHHT